MNALSPGTIVVGRYSIVRLLGEGATKVVYLADDRLAGTQVALSLLKSGQGTDPTLTARFSREGKAASVLRSPFTVRVFDVGKTDDGFRYMATEAVLGRPLDEALRYGPVDTASAVRWTLQVLLALGEAHAVGIVHRDVKPENILLEPNASGEVARLTDWGLAKVLNLDLEGSFNLRTAQGVILGTPDYMPPEQWQGMRLDGRTDIYAAGVLLFELLCGETPFFAREVHAMCVKHMTQPPPPLGERAPPQARVYEMVIHRALAKRPEDRYPSVDAMRQALEGLSGQRVVHGIDMSAAPVAEPPRGARAELVSELFPTAIHLVASPSVVLGRDPEAHVQVRCLPVTEQTAQMSRTISRRHARLDWRGGRAFVTDLSGSHTTTVNDRPVGSEHIEVRHGDVIGLGTIARLRLDTAPTVPGILPAWARLVRTDAYGMGLTTVLVLTEAKISAADDAAIPLPPSIAAGDALRVRSHEGELAVVQLGSSQPLPLRDGQQLRVGGAVIHVAVIKG